MSTGFIFSKVTVIALILLAVIESSLSGNPNTREIGSAEGLTNNSGHASFKAPSDHLSMLIAFHRQYWVYVLDGPRHFPIYVDPEAVGKGNKGAAAYWLQVTGNVSYRSV